MPDFYHFFHLLLCLKLYCVFEIFSIQELKTSLTLGELEFKNKFELENQLRNQEMKLLKDNIEKYNKYIFDLKENIERKRQVISNKKQMNVILCDLARIKKGEIQCLETLQYNNSESIKKSLHEIRKSEKELLLK